ncbi:MAG: phosphatase PAP2 family protein, partial [Acidimicrobiaceae bacterium]|nr:phosphatase PAP2 family protein [Acidimicrobiaceae bacterium]
SLPAAVQELLLVAALYLGYTGSRLLAADDQTSALRRARHLRDVEAVLHLGWEPWVNRLFIAHDWLGTFGSYWYATGHYAVTAAVLVWLYRWHGAAYPSARTTLALATVAALACYLLVPTAPPRFVDGFSDVLSLHANAGWWGAEASAPRGLGPMTNQLAAFPSMHAGWALWVALAVTGVSRSRVARLLGWTYAGITAVGVVGTGNHWILDVVVGWAVVGAAWTCTSSAHRRRHSSSVKRVANAASSSGSNP